MEEVDENNALVIGTRESVTKLEDKITMFLGEEDLTVNHPLNTRIHNPYQYVYTCDANKLLSAVRLAMNKIKA